MCDELYKIYDSIDKETFAEYREKIIDEKII